MISKERKTLFKHKLALKSKLFWFGLFLILSMFVTGIFSNSPTNITFNSSENNLTNKITALDSGPDIGIPSLSNNNPNTNSSVLVTTGVYSPNGVKNATLNFSYAYNASSYVTNMSQSLSALVSTTTFTSTGTGPSTNYKYGNFTYVSSIPISVLSLSISSVSSNILTYLLVEGKNITTGLWDLMYQNGTISSTTGYTQYTYTNNNNTFGYMIYVLSYYSNPVQVKNPKINSLLLQGLEYQATIPASQHPSVVNYNILAFDNLNQSTQSPSYQFKMDYLPQVVFNSTSLIMYKNVNYVLNVTVSDLDGISDINQNSIYAVYYQLNPLVNVSLKLSYITNLSATMDLFSGIISSSYFSSYNGTITLTISAIDMEGAQSFTAPVYLQIDTAGPIISAINYYGGVPISNWVTSAGYTPSIVVQFSDASGVKNATVYYGINGTNSFTPIQMINQTLQSNSTTVTTFNATFPSYSNTETIAFYFVSKDYLGNINTTTNYYYIVDKTAPVLFNYDTNPNTMYISNSTVVNILYNVTEVSAVKSIETYYSLDNGTTWNNNSASLINYNTYKVTSTSTYQNLPFNIPSGTTTLQLQVDQPRVDQATLKLGISFDEGSYLRIYLIGNNKSVILFDRVQGTLSNKLFTFDLFSLGFTKTDLMANNFYLEIIDYSNVYFGQITQFQFTFTYYKIPYGYQWMSTIPMSVNETTVKYYFNATDIINNTALTSVFSYFSDGDAPNINVLTNVTQVQLNESRTIEIISSVLDQGGVFDVELYYSFNNFSSYQIGSMLFNNTTGKYYYLVTIPAAYLNGTLSYYIKAYDNVGFSSTSSKENISFITPMVQTSTTSTPNASSSSSSNSPSGDISGLIIGVIAGAVVIGGIGVAVIVAYPKVKEKYMKPKT